MAAPGPRARLYVCGITPYDATHLGHAATYVAFDLLVRAWRDAGLDVRYAQNVTDVDDPLLERAAATGASWEQLAAEQTALFAEDMTALGVVPPDVYVTAVEAIPAIVPAVEGLLAAGVVYRVPVPEGEDAAGDDLYLDLARDAGFGSVARLDRPAMLELFAERGGDPARRGKRDALDPLVWRAARPGEPAWDGGALGRGRPGWHVECAVIARDGLGIPFDVQGGGSDLLFPHHEMSCAHARLLAGEASRATPDPARIPAPVRVHAHAGMVGLDGEKMSKSRGNLVFVSALRASGADPMAIRLALLAHHYREDWEWTPDQLVAAEARLQRWRSAVSGNGGPDATSALEGVRAALADDLDAPTALAVVDAWADASLTLGGDVEGAPGVMARAMNALLGVLL